MALSEASLNADARKMNRASDSAASLANMSLKSNGAAHGEPERVQAACRNPNMLPLLLEAAAPAGRSRLAVVACGTASGGPDLYVAASVCGLEFRHDRVGLSWRLSAHWACPGGLARSPVALATGEAAGSSRAAHGCTYPPRRRDARTRTLFLHCRASRHLT